MNAYEPTPRPKADSSVVAMYLTSDKKRYNPHKSEQRRQELQSKITRVGKPVRIESYLVLDGENPARRVYGIEAHAHRLADATLTAILKAKGRPITEADRQAAHSYHQKSVEA